MVPGTANEYFCERGGLDLVVEMVKTDSTAGGVRQASLYCISAVIEENGTCSCHGSTYYLPLLVWSW